MKHHHKWPDFEHYIDKAMPYMLVLLTFLIIADFTWIGVVYHDQLLLLDYIIISFFIVDLIFKWHHTKKVVKFFKLYWIDIIAIFPFYFIFRLFSAAQFFIIGEEAQKLLHETALVRETRLLREAEFAARASRMSRIVRTVARLLRLLRARWYISSLSLFRKK